MGLVSDGVLFSWLGGRIWGFYICVIPVMGYRKRKVGGSVQQDQKLSI